MRLISNAYALGTLSHKNDDAISEDFYMRNYKLFLSPKFHDEYNEMRNSTEHGRYYNYYFWCAVRFFTNMFVVYEFDEKLIETLLEFMSLPE